MVGVKPIARRARYVESQSNSLDIETTEIPVSSLSFATGAG
jgi:hypothetical protein